MKPRTSKDNRSGARKFWDTTIMVLLFPLTLILTPLIGLGCWIVNFVSDVWQDWKQSFDPEYKGVFTMMGKAAQKRMEEERLKKKKEDTERMLEEGMETRGP